MFLAPFYTFFKKICTDENLYWYYAFYNDERFFINS